VPFLKPLDSEIRVDRASLLPAIVLEVLLARCHSTTGQNFPVADLTGYVIALRLGTDGPAGAVITEWVY
jgi:hypothetical protein